MTTWNYRLVRITSPQDGHKWIEIREVYYDDNGAPSMVTERGIFAQGDTKAEVERDLKRMQGATRKPVLNYEEIGNGPKRKRK